MLLLGNRSCDWLENGLPLHHTHIWSFLLQGSEYSGPRKTELIERKRLIQLVQLQAQEVEALKDEILLLSRKGGHILPPAQPPIPHSPHMRSTLPTI